MRGLCVKHSRLATISVPVRLQIRDFDPQMFPCIFARIPHLGYTTLQSSRHVPRAARKLRSRAHEHGGNYESIQHPGQLLKVGSNILVVS